MTDTPIYAELITEFALRDRRPAPESGHAPGRPAADPAPDRDEPARDHRGHS